MQSKKFETEIGGKKMIAEFTDLAEQAHGSVILRYGNTAVLATAVMSTKTRDDIDYFPLTVDYEERFYAAGKILGGRFIKREGRPSEQATLSGRVVDRTIRPLFPQHIRNEVQVIITVLALDEEDPDAIAVNAASLALATSNIPWGGPVAAVRIGKKGPAKIVSGAAGQGGDASETISAGPTEFVVNPTYKERETAVLDILACGKDQTINMIEVGANEAKEDDVSNGLVRAVEEHNKILAWQNEIVAAIGKEKINATKPEIPAALTALFETEFKDKVKAAVFCGVAGKDAIHDVQHEWKDRVAGDEGLTEINPGLVKRFLEDKVDEEIHRGAVEDNKRPDNRPFDAIRALYAKAGGISEVLHGSGIFYRGGTHVFTALTLGGPGDSQIVDTMEEQDVNKRFMHHYNFPPFSGGETGRMGGINRRAIGHGALAEKALLPMIPDKEVFPYTIRVVSECFASNGSTSMGSVCASTLAMLDGGVPMKRPVAGIAMGLMTHGNGYKILTDIQGPEDEFGGMDFKVAGTREGITAIQLDIKLDGIPVPILTEALAGAKTARLQILDVIEKEIAAPRATISPRAPEIVMMKVKPDQIGLVIGGGGKTINGIKDVTGVEDITIEDDGSVFITGKNGTAGKAKAMIEAIVKEYKAGEVYDGEVTRMMDFGAFVRIGPGKTREGLVHVSEVAPFRIEKIGDVVTVGERVRVMIKEIDEKGRINLSIKSIDPEFASRKGVKPSTNASPASRPQDLAANKKGIDPKSILLPKKEIHSPATAQRINAGVLLEQESSATLLPEKEEAPAPAPTTPAAPKKEREMVQPLQTYQSDIEQLVEKKNVSVVNIAAAEAVRRDIATPEVVAEPAPTTQSQSKGSLIKIASVLLGILLLVSAGGALAYVLFLQEKPAATIPNNPDAPFITTDMTEPVILQPGLLSRDPVMRELYETKNHIVLSLGLIARLFPATSATSTDTPPQLVSAQTLLSILAPSIPNELVRTVDPYYYTLGIHAFDENQAFIIFKVDSYSQAYSGMLLWEKTMYNDLMPLFNRTPRPRVEGEEVSTTTPPVQVLRTTFADRVVENRDSRVVQNEAGDILLLWTFLDRSTIVITTNNYTLLEIIARFKDISIVPQF